MAAARPLVAIGGCSAEHLLGEASISLINDAELALIEVHGSSTTPPLTITLGDKLAFPLTDGTLLGTQAGNGRVYLLRPHLDNLQGPQGWIRIAMPAEVEELDSELGKKRDLWEDILVRHGFLLGTGVRAGGDEIAAGLREAGDTTATGIQARVQRYTESHPPTDTPASFSQTTHDRAQQVSSVTQQASNLAKQATSAIVELSHGAGEGIAKAFNLGQKPENEKSDIRKTTEDAARALGDMGAGAATGSAGAGQAATKGLTDTIRHDQGEEAAEIAGHVFTTAGNVGNVAGGAIITTSLAAHGMSAAQGVAEVDLQAGE